ncbi:hypothetical protein F4804DRAFT_54980 [Jackrogersella minutella]|nr:hypothetical protein F4804DRAFT_54980 [Jackrogersella minutella]
MSSSQLVWYCCCCYDRGVPCWGLSYELHPACVECGHRICSDCRGEEIWGGTSDTLSSESEGNGTLITKHNFRELGEALRYENGALPSNSKASPKQTQSTTPSRYFHPTENTLSTFPEPATSIHPKHGQIEPISEAELEIGRLCEHYEDGERTPRSTVDPTDLDMKNIQFPLDPFGPCDFDQGDLFSYPYPPHQDTKEPDVFPNDDNQSAAPSAGFFDNIDIELFKTLDLEYNYEPHSSPCAVSGSFLSGFDAITEIGPAIDDPTPGSYSHNITSLLQLPNEFCQLPATEPLAGPNETSPPILVTPNPPKHKYEDRQQTTKESNLSQADCEHAHIDVIDRACKFCALSTKPTTARTLACLFYKHNPSLYERCFHKEFKNISALRQHLDKDHKLGTHHCSSCWISFNDEMSLTAHKDSCQPTGGIPVDKLPPIYKAHDNPGKKWYWTFRQLFGHTATPPKCPYPHPRQDLLDQFCQHLEAKGTKFDEFQNAILDFK